MRPFVDAFLSFRVDRLHCDALYPLDGYLLRLLKRWCSIKKASIGFFNRKILTMSEHFTSKEKAEDRTDWKKWFRRDFQPKTPAEIRFVRHAKVRAGLFLIYLAGFTYMNPEWSWTATKIQTWYREYKESEAAAEQLRVTPSMRREPSKPA